MRRVATEHTESVFEGFRYRDAELVVLWHTSVPRTAQQAVDYIDFVAAHLAEPEYLEGRDPEGSYHPIKWEIVNDSTGERTPFVSALERRFSGKT